MSKVKVNKIMNAIGGHDDTNFEGVQVINPGDDLVEAKHQLIRWCSDKYPHVVGIFTKGKVVLKARPTRKGIEDELNGESTSSFYTITEQEQDEVSCQGKEFTKLVDQIHTKRTQEWLSYKDTVEIEMKRIYFFLLNRCNIGLKDIISQDKEWDTAQNQENPILLWNIIRRNCIQGVYSTDVDRARRARRALQDIVMVEGELVNKFRKRFQAIVKKS